MGAYLALAAAGARARLQYPLSFVLRAATTAAADLVGLALIGLVLARFPSVGGWRFRELALLFGLIQAATGVARVIIWPLDHFEEVVASGDFDTFLIRPLSPLLHLLCFRVEVSQLLRALVGVTVLAVVFRLAGVPATAANLALAAAAVAGGTLLLVALTMMVGSLAFWQTRTGKLQDIVQNGTRSFAEMPLTIYPSSVRAALTWLLPMALVTYYPALRLLGRPADGPAWLAWAALPAGALFLGLALALWRLGVRRYHSTGS